MNKTNELVCAHSALLFAALMGLGIFGIAGWLPPIHPDLSGDEIATLFQQHTLRIRLGMTVLALASVFWWSFSAAIAMRMKRIEGASHPLAYVQMASASGTVIVILLAAYFWLVIAYRPDQTSGGSPQMFNDFAWLTFVGAYPPAVIQNLSLALCILTDRNKVRLYPAWVGYFNIWIAVLDLPGALLPFFKTGPFAWNGIIGFWLVAVAFFGWILVMWRMTVLAIEKSDE